MQISLEFVYRRKINPLVDQDQFFNTAQELESIFLRAVLITSHLRDATRVRKLVEREWTLSAHISEIGEDGMQVNTKNLVAFVCGTAAAILIAIAFSVTGSQTANAMPAYAQQTGKPCGFCHQNAAGGGALKPAGEKFKANGHKL